MDSTGFAPLARFHVRVGARLALRAAAPLAGLPFVVVLVQADPAGAVREAAAWLLGRAGGPGAGLFVALVAVMLAGWAQPRLTAALDGWPRHWPVSAVTQRRAVLLGLVAAQTPLLVGLLSLAPTTATQASGLAFGRLASLLPILAAAAVASWPGTGARFSRPLAVAALVLMSRATATTVVLAAALVVLGERWAGPLARHGRAQHRRSSRSTPAEYLIAVRALGWSLAGTMVLSLVPVLAMTALRVNNDLAPGVAAGAARFGGGLGVVLLVAAVAEGLAVRRPAWPWARSLPVSSWRRVGEDAVLQSSAALMPLSATAVLDPLAASTLALCVPFLALRAACRPRFSAGRRSSHPLGEGALLAASVAIVPSLAFAVLLATPLVWRAAAFRARAQKVTHWDGLHHSAVGDPLSWSGR